MSNRSSGSDRAAATGWRRPGGRAELGANQAGLIVVGQPTLEKGFDKAVTRATKVLKHTVDATADEIAGEMKGAAQKLTPAAPPLFEPTHAWQTVHRHLPFPIGASAEGSARDFCPES